MHRDDPLGLFAQRAIGLGERSGIGAKLAHEPAHRGDRLAPFLNKTLSLTFAEHIEEHEANDHRLKAIIDGPTQLGNGLKASFIEHAQEADADLNFIRRSSCGAW
jgi:hypothetical protein